MAILPKIFKALNYENHLNEGVNPAFVGDGDVEKIEKLIASGKSDKTVIKELILSVYSKYEKKLQNVKAKFDKLISVEVRKIDKSGHTKIITGMKPVNSILDKAVDRRKGISNIVDLVRGAILFPSKKEADEFVRNFVRKNRSIVIDQEEKERGLDKTYGYYGSHHLKLNIDGFFVEIQIMTKKLWSYKKQAHKIYTQTRSKENGPSKTDTSLSKRIFSLGNRPGYVREDIFTDSELHENDYFSSFKEVDYRNLL